jgi:hypothetical protein
MQKDTFNDIKITQILADVVATATKTSAEYDATGDESVSFFVSFGICGDTLSGSRSWLCKCQHAATASGALTDFVAADYVIGPNDTAATTFGLINAAADDPGVFGVGVSDNLTDRYFKVVVTLTGTNANGTPMSIYAVSKPKTNPAGNLITPA